MLKLKIIVGSTRPGRAADRVIPWITDMSREHGDFNVDILAWWAKALQQARTAGTLPLAAFRLMAATEGAGK